MNGAAVVAVGNPHIQAGALNEFIQPDDGGEDVFVHYAEIKDDGSTNKFKMLYEGDRVEYTPASSGKGTQAKDVVKLSSGEARSE